MAAKEEEAAKEGEDVPMEAAEEEAKEETKEEAKDEETKEEETKEEEAAKEAEPAAAPVPEEPKELEEDAPEDSRAKVKPDDVSWNVGDSTVNAMVVSGGSVLMSLIEGGFEFLFAGIRSTVGVKSGRYMYEVKVIEAPALNAEQSASMSARVPQPRNIARMGFCTAGSTLFLHDGTENVFFDTEGYFFHGKKKTKVGTKIKSFQTAAILLNLDGSSPNAFTMSLFVDGVRSSTPQSLPEELRGKALFPVVAYKNTTLVTNLGPSPTVDLPFKCNMFKQAAQEDSEVKSAVSTVGPCKVIFPVGLPEQGVFDWLDSYLKANPDCTELSDRAVLDWAHRSAVWRPKGYNYRSSNDKPGMNFGITSLDDMSVQNLMASLAPALKRNFVSMELSGNLLVEERKKALQRFAGPQFQKIAKVMIGEPTEEYKSFVREKILATKVAEAEAEKKKKLQDQERKRLLEERKKKVEQSKRARQAQKGENGEDEKMEAEPEKVEEEKKEEEAGIEETPEVTLTEEEQNLWFRKQPHPDLTEASLAKHYAHFSLPTKEEGFDVVDFEWYNLEKSTSFLRDWVLDQKRTLKAEDLQPSEESTATTQKWQKQVNEWKRRQIDWKDPVKRKQLLKKAEDEAKKKAEELGDEAPPQEPKELTETDIANLDALTVENVNDLGNGEPLYFYFEHEDWQLLQIRFEMHHLLHSFSKDLNDPDRQSFGENHLPYYYEKYFRRGFALQKFAVKQFEEFQQMIRDVFSIADSGMLQTELPADTSFDQFMRLTEEHRRERERRVDAGDETAKLTFPKPQPPARSGGAGQQASGRDQAVGQRRPAPPANARGDRKGDNRKGDGRRASDSRSAPVGYGGGGSSGRSYAPSSGSVGSSRYGSGAPTGGSAYRGAPPGKRAYESGGGGQYSSSKHQRTGSYSGGGGGGGSSYSSATRGSYSYGGRR